MARDAGVDFGDLGLTKRQDEEVRALLFRDRQAQKEKEFRALRLAHNEYGFRVTIREKGGDGGEVTMMIPPTLYHECGSFYGYKCWEDLEFCGYAMKRWPEIKVHTKSRNPIITVPDFAPEIEAKPKLFSKTYENASPQPSPQSGEGESQVTA